MIIKETEIQEMDRINRINLINSLSGIKPAHLIGTVSISGVNNLAIFNSVVHIGSNPPLLGFVLRPDDDVRRDTFNNLATLGYFTINHVHESFYQKAHYTSAKFASDVSEFAKCGLTPTWIDNFPAPFVEESQVKIGLEFIQRIPIEINGTSLVIGKIVILDLPEEMMEENGHLNLATVSDVGISGLNTYYRIRKIGRMPYARPDEVPAVIRDSDITS